MLKFLFLPGALFLGVILLRVVIPYISTSGWKRILDSARYSRFHKDFNKADRLLEKAVEKYPNQAEVYLEYFLNHSDSTNLEHRFKILNRGYEKTKDTALSFFLGSTYLEHGEFDKAIFHLNGKECRNYMKARRLTLLPQLYYEQGRYSAAEKEFIDFYSDLFGIENAEFESNLDRLSPQELLTLAMIKKESGFEYSKILNLAPKSSFHSDMSWKDLLQSLKESFNALEPAVTGIDGDPGEFNRRRKEYYSRRIRLIESYL